GYYIGLIDILLGLVVGGAVSVGSRRRGGRAYQVLAVVLSYLSISANFLPAAMQQVTEKIDHKKKEAASDVAAKQPPPGASDKAAVPDAVPDRKDAKAPPANAKPQREP